MTDITPTPTKPDGETTKPTAETRKPRTVVIAPTKGEGLERFPNAVAVVTPRAPHASRGIVADRIVTLRSMDNHPKVVELHETATASLATAATDEAETDDEGDED